VRGWESISDAGLELAVEDEGRIASIVCRGTLDSRTAERMLHELDVPVPLRAYPARPSRLLPDSDWAAGG
jgi:hypothetical protein